MAYLEHLPPWLCGVIIVSSFVVFSIIGLALFQWLTVGRLRLTEEMNNDIIFFASAIAVFYSLTVGLIAVGDGRLTPRSRTPYRPRRQLSVVSIATSAAIRSRRELGCRRRCANTPFF